MSKGNVSLIALWNVKNVRTGLTGNQAVQQVKCRVLHPRQNNLVHLYKPQWRQGIVISGQCCDTMDKWVGSKIKLFLTSYFEVEAYCFLFSRIFQ